MDGLGGSQDLRSRGATHVDLLVTDGHDGLLAAVSDLFSATPRQRCLVHKQRNMMLPRHPSTRTQRRSGRTGRHLGTTDQTGGVDPPGSRSPAKYAQRYPEAVRSLVEDEEHLLTFYEFPVSMHRHIQTTNAIESL